MKKSRPMRVSPELMKKVFDIRAKCILEGRRIPSNAEITRAIARQIDEKLLWNEFIRL